MYYTDIQHNAQALVLALSFSLPLYVSLFLYLYYFCNVLYMGTMYDDIYLKFFFFDEKKKKYSQLEWTC